MMWSTPQGGQITNNDSILGYNNLVGNSANTHFQADGSQWWDLVDMDGDGKPDLLVTGLLDSIGFVQFNASTNPNWHVFLNTGDGFANTPVSWSTPVGGEIKNNRKLGFNITNGEIQYSDQSGSQSWALTDINGDGKPDLVVTATGGPAAPGSEFNAVTTPHWLVYINIGNGFSDSALLWATPKGGFIYYDDTLGYDYINTTNWGVEGYNNGQRWSLVDMNGDNKPDLVVTSEEDTLFPIQFGALTSPHWLVYLNTGMGFSDSSISWTTPVGGASFNYQPEGYSETIGLSLTDTDNQQWLLQDMNGDKMPDLVIPSVIKQNGPIEFNSTNSPYWLVYLNNGHSFADSAISWYTPVGGRITNDSLLGFVWTYGYAQTGQTIGNQDWYLSDLDNDGKPDLIVSGSLLTDGNNEWGEDSIPFWKIYKNTGTSFSDSAQYWITPVGGEYRGIQLGFNFSGYGIPTLGQDNLTSQIWTLTDINGDGYPDMVVEGDLQENGITQFNTSDNPYWRVFGNVLGDPLELKNNIKESTTCLLYPNPNSGSFELLFKDDAIRNIEVTDITGKKIITGLQVSKEAKLLIPNYAPGIYLVTIKESGLTQVMKVVITK